MNYEIGTRIGDYTVLDVLGAGGMGKVYKVQNQISDRIEAMKVLLPNLEGDPELADRFVREIKVQAKLDHPNIAALHTALRLDNQLVMLMEFVEGVTIEALLKNGPLPIEKAIDYICQVLSALSYAHAHGIVHRDLKPANMILTPQGTIKLMDFGIAKLVADRKLTQTGATVGSLYYMSPEQIQGAANLDARSDLYSLGAALYEIITGLRPFQGDSEYSIMSAHLEKTPVPPIQIDPSLPPALSEIVLMAVEKDVAKRFQSADAFRNALLNILPGAAKAARAPEAATAPLSMPPPLPPAPAAPAAFAPPPIPRAPAAQSQTPAVQAAAPAAAAGRSGGRGLYIALGALIAVVVLVVAATQLPRYIGTHAASPTASPTSTQPAVTTPVQPAASAPAPVQAITPAVVEQNAQKPVTPSAPAARPPAAASASADRNPPPPAYTPMTVPVPKKKGFWEKIPLLKPRSQKPSSAESFSPPPTAPAVPTATPPLAAGPDPKVMAELSGLRENLVQLDIRAATVRSSLARLQQSQARQGLGLRADMTAAADRMEYSLNAADGALKRGSVAEARKNLDAAERAVSKMEDFLGH